MYLSKIHYGEIPSASCRSAHLLRCMLSSGDPSGLCMSSNYIRKESILTASITEIFNSELNRITFRAMVGYSLLRVSLAYSCYTNGHHVR